MWVRARVILTASRSTSETTAAMAVISIMIILSVHTRVVQHLLLGLSQLEMEAATAILAVTLLRVSVFVISCCSIHAFTSHGLHLDENFSRLGSIGDGSWLVNDDSNC